MKKENNDWPKCSNLNLKSVKITNEIIKDNLPKFKEALFASWKRSDEFWGYLNDKT